MTVGGVRHDHRHGRRGWAAVASPHVWTVVQVGSDGRAGGLVRAVGWFASVVFQPSRGTYQVEQRTVAGRARRRPRSKEASEAAIGDGPAQRPEGGPARVADGAQRVG